MDRRFDLDSIYRPLWLTYGLVPLLAGLDKFFNLLADWPAYLSPLAADLLPLRQRLDARIGREVRRLYLFHEERCDRLTAKVFARLGIG
ncbi:MAG TPA: hypothetical protein VF121_01945 [Thermoanaerobaculia bacterium]|nr:hypothetical protein [Thermoanaerobaculia bacterium]